MVTSVTAQLWRCRRGMRWKTRAIAMVVVIILAISFVLPVSAISDDEVAAPSAILMEPKTGKILYEKNANEVRACASITKVMTLVLVMEAIDSGKISLDDQVAASAHAASMGGSDIWLKEGETMSVNDLVKATVIMSANDAAVVLAEHIYGTEDEFVKQMNIRAKQLGMNDTTFKNCNGLDEDGHLTTAHDVALMSAELIKHEKIFDYTLTWMDYLRDGQTQLVNTNKLIRSYKGITGLKTGTTGQAGSCISATAKRDSLSLVAVVLGCSTTDERFSSSAKLLDYGFANYAFATLPIPELGTVPVSNGQDGQVQTECGASAEVLVPKGKESAIKSEVELSQGVEAPVEKGQLLGKVKYKLDGELIAEYAITAKKPVEKISFGSSFMILLRSLFHW